MSLSSGWVGRSRDPAVTPERRGERLALSLSPRGAQDKAAGASPWQRPPGAGELSSSGHGQPWWQGLRA